MMRVSGVQGTHKGRPYRGEDAPRSPEIIGVPPALFY